MGNESSHLAGLEIDEKAVEVTDFWTHSSAVVYNENITSLSVFIGESFVEGSLWRHHTPLEKTTKNLMLHRHPCILKYISSWNKGSRLYLAVEYVKPLAHSLSSQTSMQMCIGLYSILKALTFLHENALSSHNNLCCSSIYVTKDGSWKLGGFEYLCRFQDLTPDYLSKTRLHRYDKSVDPNEETNSNDEQFLKSGAIDKYAFSVLVNELLHSKGNDEIPCVEEFRKFCKTELQNQNFTARPSFNSLLKHPYFTHDFIIIYSFLTELALKCEKEKEQFFSDVVIKLHCFPEEIVARQLGELLLSRLVLLDKTAQSDLLPHILMPRLEDSSCDGPIFSVDIFKQYIVPKLLHIFCVRDAQIRLLLLTHFKNYVDHFTKEQLQNHILPELLIGIKDTNDHLVSVTLVALSDLVPVLGATTVIGGTRLKLFNDGRPATTPIKTVPSFIAEPLSEQTSSSSLDPSTTESSMSYSNHVLELSERLSPEGGEDELQPAEVTEEIVEDDLDNWSDWDANDENNSRQENEEQILEERMQSVLHVNETTIPVLSTKSKVDDSDNKLPDILTLDIKNMQNIEVENRDEFNFFSDMEPVIEKTNKFFIDEDENNECGRTAVDMKLLGDVQVNEDEWGDDLSWAEK